MWEFNNIITIITISDNETKIQVSILLATAQKFVQTSMALTISNQNFNGDTKTTQQILCMRNIDNCTKNYTKLIKVSQLISGYNNRCGYN